MNPSYELKKLTSLFPEGNALFDRAEHIPAAITPEPYKRLLVHDNHMTETMEEFHHSPVVVKVLDRKLEGEIYSRKILLERSNDSRVVQFALVQFDLSVVQSAVRDEILSERTPLGRILINYNVLRHVNMGAILQITAGPAFARLCGCPAGEITYGRLATIFCDQRPAVDLLEVAAGLPPPRAGYRTFATGRPATALPVPVLHR
jgi:chorismate-pyruvate lyase